MITVMLLVMSDMVTYLINNIPSIFLHCRHMAFNTGNGITQTIKSGTTDNSNHCDMYTIN